MILLKLWFLSRAHGVLILLILEIIIIHARFQAGNVPFIARPQLVLVEADELTGDHRGAV